MTTPFGKAIRKARIDLGVTMAQMAEEIGYPPILFVNARNWKEAY